MLKGYVFKEQVFPVQIFAFFIDTFLRIDGGIGKKYGNEMKMTYNGSKITVQDGIVCIKGRFLGEDSFTTLEAGVDNMFCKLVIEIDLDKENTEEALNQVNYKIIKSNNNFPELTQTDITVQNSGIYQFELARFKTNTSGIIEFEDKRKFLDIDSIYAEMRKDFNLLLNKFEIELANVKDGSAYMLKSMILSGTEEPTNEQGNNGDLYIQYLE